ncbi:MAG: 3-oxoacyl-(acyl-carrier-protein) reductase FabG [Candidatus Omnitrophica bacterium ADurb.Bin277]|nr:MAG: 3-oxoacyl-(acyl-carrier-protein) reductase FabG [Candidatus Omnitrophica bacterium ADurb.Bin277]
MKLFLSGKKILITGGTSALGEAFIRRAVACGAEVHFTYLTAEAKALELETAGAKKHTVDLSDKDKIDAFLKSFVAKNASLDVLIHNAAATADAMIENMSEEAWEKVLAVDLKAPFYLTQKLLPLLLAVRPAKIFTIVSRAGSEGLMGAANYAAAKGGLIAMTKTLARELGRKQILVNAINPGFMMSRMTEKISKKAMQNALERSPLRTYSDPEEVAAFLVYLSSNLVRQVTGQVFHFESRPL